MSEEDNKLNKEQFPEGIDEKRRKEIKEILDSFSTKEDEFEKDLDKFIGELSNGDLKEALDKLKTSLRQAKEKFDKKV